MSSLSRNNVKVSGSGSRTILFAHGFGCDQAMWRFVAPHFEEAFKVVSMDHVGAGGSDLDAYDRKNTHPSMAMRQISWKSLSSLTSKTGYSWDIQ